MFIKKLDSYFSAFYTKKKNGEIESFFYDPWYQRCCTKEPSKPKIFSDISLIREMEELIKQTNMIQPTKALLNLDSWQNVKNTRRDFSYFITCSTDEFTNPTEEIEVPEIAKKLPLNCVIH